MNYTTADLNAGNSEDGKARIWNHEEESGTASTL